MRNKFNKEAYTIKPLECIRVRAMWSLLTTRATACNLPSAARRTKLRRSPLVQDRKLGNKK